MGHIQEVAAHRVEILTPVEAGRSDPPMQEWLALPVGDACPACGSTHWGTTNPVGYFAVRVCHDEHGKGCREHFRSAVTPEMIRRVVGALCGEAIRLGRS